MITNNYDVDDLMQDAFIKALNAYRNGSFIQGGNFSAWFTQIAKNLFIDSIRKRKLQVELKDADGVYEEYEDDYSDLIELVKRHLRELPRNQQLIIMLRLNGKKYQEIADDLGISLENVKTNRHLAIKKLKLMLNNLTPSYTEH